VHLRCSNGAIKFDTLQVAVERFIFRILMKKELPEEIQESIDLLEKAESQKYEIEMFVKTFSNGIEILHEYLEDNPDSHFKTYIENLISTHIRQFLIKLPELEVNDFNTWITYCLLHKNAIKYLYNIFDESPFLKENYLTLINDETYWGEAEKLSRFEKRLRDIKINRQIL